MDLTWYRHFEKYYVSAEAIINDGFSESKYGKCIKIRIK
jgi:hypothetical protein